MRVHNLQDIDLEIPRQQLVVLCGVSGSGKTSLALDTLYAEGQRRYIESFSAYTRQLLDQLDKPDADRIEGIPPSIAVTRTNPSTNSRSTVGTATESVEYLRLLYSRIAQLHCPTCEQPIERASPQSIADVVASWPSGARYMVVAEQRYEDAKEAEESIGELQRQGYARVLIDGRTINLDSIGQLADIGEFTTLYVVIDRLSASADQEGRLLDSLETAFDLGNGRCQLLRQYDEQPERSADATGTPKRGVSVDGRSYEWFAFSHTLRCHPCDEDFIDPEPRLFSFNNALGACATCEGFGSVHEIDMELVVPDKTKSLREGAIAPWNTPAYAHELKELLDLADDYEIPVDVPYHELTERHIELIDQGVPERDFGGLRGFFAWLEKRKYKMHLRVFMSRWRSYHTCSACHGLRLKPFPRAFTIGGASIADVSLMKVVDARKFFETLELSAYDEQVGRKLIQQVTARLGYLCDVGLGYLSLDRPLRTLSGGEAQRVALTSALGSTLVNMLYVLDEPTVGLHPRDVAVLVSAIEGLRQRGNSVVVVEHEEEMIKAADQLIEIGPGAGDGGGQVVFQGTPDELLNSKNQSTTADFLLGRRGLISTDQRRPPTKGRIRLKGARGNNLKNISVEFPLGLLCLVTGVSGSGKSSLVQETLYGALCRRKRKQAEHPLAYDDVFGDGQIDDVVLVDQSPIGRSPRSNPVTYIKAFDDIRKVFAETIDAKTHNFKASHFSFNVDGGRCPKCTGEGHLAIDMQFLADVYMKCSACHGTRYRREILAVKYRNKNIAEVLEMTVHQAFSFFRGYSKLQAKLKRLIDVGLGYLRLGQSATTLSSGEAQRLKLASYTAITKRSRTLFLLDEPTTGLHFSDIVQLLDCFDALLNVGHSLIVVEHNLQVMKSADYIIDIGPGAAELGGEVVVEGTPELVAEHPDSITGRYLRQAFRQATVA